MDRFSLGLLLGSVGKDSYIPLFTSRGYVTLAKCAEITEQDITSMGIPYTGYSSQLRSDYAGMSN